MSQSIFSSPARPDPADDPAAWAGLWALRKYGGPYIAGEESAPDPRQDYALNPCRSGDEAECIAWLSECLTETYN